MRQFVSVILVKSDGSVLSQHRDNIPEISGPDTWCACGGALEPTDSSLKYGAARELKEETGYEVKESDLKLLTEDTYQNEKGVQIHRNIFWAEYDGNQPIGCSEGQEIRFISPSEFHTLNFYQGHENFLRLATQVNIRSSRERR
ncbi:MAG: NUDIX hydrolase [Candidatus Shapirobacteria bacterium]